MKKRFFLLCFFGLSFLFVLAQTNKIESSPLQDLQFFQNSLQTAIKTVAPATVLITTQEKLTPTGGVSASGVCVSADGIIMTAGHLTIPNGKYEIIFPDGKKFGATGLGKIGMLDAGLLKINDVGSYPYAHLGSSSSLKIGETCFSIAYPGSFQNKEVIRLGQVKKVVENPGKDIRDNHIQTTCLMEPGDSGGPVFDMKGQVIGIRSYIGLPLDENFDVPVDTYRKYWDILLKQENYNGIPEDVVVSQNPNSNIFFWNKWTEELQKKMNTFSSSTIQIISDVNGKENKILGTVVSLKNLTTQYNTKQSYVVTKNSEIGNTPKAVVNNKTYAASIIYTDTKIDLALLKIDAKVGNPIVVEDNAPTDKVGEILVSPIVNAPLKFSVWGYKIFSLPGVHNTGYLGLRLEQNDGKNIVATVQPNTAASESGLKVGDEIITIDQVNVDFLETFIAELKKKKAEEQISIVRKSEGRMDTVSVKLKSRPAPTNVHVAEQFTDGKSERRDDFQKIFIQDATLKPSECGGPVFDIDGNFVGINMARYSRVSSLAIPVSIVVDFLKNAIK